jgi:ferredoxin-NADP reductase
MAKTKVGTVFYWRKSSPILAVFRLMPESGSQFPPYRAGQYIAIQRNDCRLTRKVIAPDRTVSYLPVLDDAGDPKKGAVAHSYSIASAPFETLEKGCLEFYVILEVDQDGVLGRLTESLFRMDPGEDNQLIYFDKIAGDFTLEKRTAGHANVVFVGTGTGLAPFVSMIKQLHCEAGQEKSNRVRYTLIHANRTAEELDYRDELKPIEEAGRLDFVYLSSVSRPTDRDLRDPGLGKGRANNVLRHILEMPLREEQDLEDATRKGEDIARARTALERTVRPILPGHVTRAVLQERLKPSSTVILTCGNPSLMEDIKCIAGANGIRFEKEDW